jgi:tRNA(Arg) A34 adenosine deaminase TadA
MSSATDTWKSLSLPWQVAFEEAWAAYRAGTFGVGAVLVDPANDDAIVTAGRNRVMQQQRSPRTLSGNMTAHAEMNAFAELDQFDAEGLHLYTTLEPCLMCAAAAMLLKVEHVHFAARDEFYAGLDELWGKHSLTAARQPTSTGPFDGPLGPFGRLLAMTFDLEQLVGLPAEQLARDKEPALTDLIDRIATDEQWIAIRKSGTVHRALGHLWGEFEALS